MVIRMKFIITFKPDEDGGFVAECPALPGCVSHGYTMQEAKANIVEAIELWIETAKDLGIARSTSVEEVEVAV